MQDRGLWIAAFGRGDPGLGKPRIKDQVIEGSGGGGAVLGPLRIKPCEQGKTGKTRRRYGNGKGCCDTCHNSGKTSNDAAEANETPAVKSISRGFR